jgi:hypothetical protein
MYNSIAEALMSKPLQTVSRRSTCFDGSGSGCGKTKPVADFYRQGSGRPCKLCKECYSERVMERDTCKKERFLVKYKELPPNTAARRLMDGIKGGSIKQGYVALIIGEMQKGVNT